MVVDTKKTLLYNLPSLRLLFTPSQSSFWELLPSKPGIYIFEDENKNPLYIGKSINLRSRLKQHYEGFLTGTTKAANFIPQTHSLYLKVVNNDVEAVIIEANFIKQYKPRYNAITKDGRSNVYIIFTNPPDSKIKIIHATDIQTLDLDNYQRQVFGPYTSASTAQMLLKQIRYIFGYCTTPFNAHGRACFNYHLGHCPGACQFLVTPKQYQKHLGHIKKFLSGHFTKLNRLLSRRINDAIKKQKYEEAEIIKHQIESLDQAIGSQNTTLLLKLSDSNDQLQHLIVDSLHHPKLHKAPQRIECYDLAHLQGQNYVGSMVVFINGQPSVADYRHFKIKGESDKSDPYAMKQILSRRFNHPEWGRPDLLVLDGGIPQLSIVNPVIPVDIPVIALAKKRETIYFFDENKRTAEVNLNIEDPVLNLFRSIRDEAHRFATTFHIQQRSKSLIS